MPKAIFLKSNHVNFFMFVSIKQKIYHPAASSVEMAEMKGPVEVIKVVVEEMAKKVVDSEVQGGGAD